MKDVGGDGVGELGQAQVGNDEVGGGHLSFIIDGRSKEPLFAVPMTGIFLLPIKQEYNSLWPLLLRVFHLLVAKNCLC